MAGFHQFFMIFSWNSLILGQYILGVGGRGAGVGWAGGVQGWGGWWQKLRQRRNKTQIVEFRVVVTCTCTHKGPTFHYKA